jgi:hypothetical protein
LEIYRSTEDATFFLVLGHELSIDLAKQMQACAGDIRLLPFVWYGD